MSISDEQFDEDVEVVWTIIGVQMADRLRARDTTQREALARVEAERDWWKEQRDILADYCRRADERARAAQAQLAEAVGLLKRANGDRSFPPKLERDVFSFLARHAQAEQQVAKSPMAKVAEAMRHKAAKEWANHPSNPARQEAQGAQAGDERAAFERWAKERSWFDPQPSTKERDDSLFFYEDAITDHNWIAWQARAALATQPGAIKLPERKRTDHLPAEYKIMTPTRASIESYNRALDDVAALNAVRGAEHDQ